MGASPKPGCQIKLLCTVLIINPLPSGASGTWSPSAPPCRRVLREARRRVSQQLHQAGMIPEPLGAGTGREAQPCPHAPFFLTGSPPNMCWGPASVVLVSRIPFHFPVPSSRPQGICRVHGCRSCSEGLSSQDCPCSPLEPRPHGPFPAKQVQLMCPWWGVLHRSPFSIATSDFKYELPRAWLHPVRKVSVSFSCAFCPGEEVSLISPEFIQVSPAPRIQGLQGPPAFLFLDLWEKKKEKTSSREYR